MPRRMRIGCALLLGLALAPRDASAQRYYPCGYGRYGWGGWGADPSAGYMAGLGAFARGQGVYQLENAKAQAINLDTMLKWNQALRARQRELQQQRQKEEAQLQARRDARVERMELEDGTTLNRLLMQILDFDPSATRSARARAPIGGAAIRDIPFEWDTEAITICIDQLTGQAALPSSLSGGDFVEQRAALGSAVKEALEEDTKGDVSPATMKRVAKAVDDFHAKFASRVSRDDPDYSQGEEYFSTLASLSRLLHDPGMKGALAELGNDRQMTVGDLISFMQTYNLRFGPATTGRQLEIYQTLDTHLKGVLGDMNRDVASPRPGSNPPREADEGGEALQDAARDAFKGMNWPQLEAHARQP